METKQRQELRDGLKFRIPEGEMDQTGEILTCGGQRCSIQFFPTHRIERWDTTDVYRVFHSGNWVTDETEF